CKIPDTGHVFTTRGFGASSTSTRPMTRAARRRPEMREWVALRAARTSASQSEDVCVRQLRREGDLPGRNRFAKFFGGIGAVGLRWRIVAGQKQHARGVAPAPPAPRDPAARRKKGGHCGGDGLRG